MFTFLGELLIRKYKAACPSDFTSLQPAAGEMGRQEGKKMPPVLCSEVNRRSAYVGVIWAVVAS